jgi:adenosine deaminase
LSFHVHEAVDIAGASRIGHAVDVLGESGSSALVQEMAANDVGVEVCLTSNQQLLGVEGSSHPAQTLLHKGVPVAFATDDQGILRTDMNAEITRAFAKQDMNYHEVKRAIRSSMSMSFLPGTRLRDISACKASVIGEKLQSACKNALASSERATAEWQLETALDTFEKDVLSGNY